MIRYFPALMGALLCASALFAQDSSERQKQLFKTLDTNGDGILTKDEIPRDKAVLFDRLVTLGDSDNDGKLTEQELVAGLNRPKDDAPSADEPGAGRPSAEERADFFQRMDRNRDGVVSKDEVPEFLKERFAPMFELVGKDEITQEQFAQFNPGAGRPQGRRGTLPPREQFFARLDANGDGKITLDEVPDQAKDNVKEILTILDKGEITGDDYDRFVEISRRRQDGGGRNPDGQGRPGMLRGEGMGPGGFRGGPVFLRVLDENHDGRLSKQELAMAAYHFDELDADGDGHLDARELFGAPPGGFGEGRGFGNRGPGGANPDDPNRPARPQRPDGSGSTTNNSDRPNNAANPNRRRPGGNSGEFAKRFFDQFDKNGDGKLSKDEAQDDRIASRFSAMDSDGDGNVTLEEFQAVFARGPNRD